MSLLLRLWELEFQTNRGRNKDFGSDFGPSINNIYLHFLIGALVS